MEQIINLVFPKDLTKLAGNRYGRSIFSSQVKSTIDYSGIITFVFPDRINGVSSSFIQGFFSEIVLNIGIDGVHNKIHYITSIPNFDEFVMRNLI